MKWADNAQSRFYYRGREHQHDQLQAAVDRIGNPQGKSLLDVGCGYGDLLALLPPRVRYTGIDSNPDAIEEAKRLHPRQRFLCTDQPSPAQVVVVVATLQCVSDPVGFTRQLWAATGETLVIVTLKDAKLPLEKQGLGWQGVLPSPEVFESDDDWLVATAHRPRKRAQYGSRNS